MDAQRPQLLINKCLISVNTQQCFVRIGQEPQPVPLTEAICLGEASYDTPL